MMDELCRQFQESYGESDLSPELSEHSAQCAACAEFVRKQEALKTVLPAWETPEFADDFDLQVMARIAEEGNRQRSIWEVLKGLMQTRLAVPVPVGAVGALLMVCSLILNFNLWKEDGAGGNERGPQHIAIETPAYTHNVSQGEDVKPTPQVYVMESGTPFTLPPELLSAGAILVIPPVMVEGSYGSFMPYSAGPVDDTQKTETQNGI